MSEPTKTHAEYIALAKKYLTETAVMINTETADEDEIRAQMETAKLGLLTAILYATLALSAPDDPQPSKLRRIGSGLYDLSTVTRIQPLTKADGTPYFSVSFGKDNGCAFYGDDAAAWLAVIAEWEVGR